MSQIRHHHFFDKFKRRDYPSRRPNLAFHDADLMVGPAERKRDKSETIDYATYYAHAQA